MLRRNGTRSSCEPCRKAKVKCDHHSPFCQRCEARGISASCVYHPAPLTRSPAPEARRIHKLSTQQYQTCFGVLDLSGDRLSEPALPSTQASFTAPLAPPAKMQIYNNAASNAIHSCHPSSFGGSDVELNAQSAPKAAGSGYYGSTSYYSVFDRPRADRYHRFSAFWTCWRHALCRCTRRRPRREPVPSTWILDTPKPPTRLHHPVPRRHVHSNKPSIPYGDFDPSESCGDPAAPSQWRRVCSGAKDHQKYAKAATSTS
jgi:hypothetical protein